MQNEAILMLFLSEYRIGNEEVSYQAEAYPGEVFKGSNTNDSTTRYLLRKAHDAGTPIGKVLCITSRKVRSEIVSEQKTAFELYSDLIQKENTLLGNTNQVDIIPVPYDYLESDPDETATIDPSQQPQYIYEIINQKLLNMAEKGTDRKLYVDITGGPRDTVFLLITIAKYLEYSGYSVSEAVYSNRPQKVIVSVAYMFNMLQIINSMNTFVTTGNAAELERSYDQLPENAKNDSIHNALAAMVDFSHSISIGNVGQIDLKVSNINSALDQCRKSNHQSVFSSMFETMQPLFAEKMMTKKGKVSYFRMINWCLDNNLIQQAATLYIEKMPEIYCRHYKNIFNDFLMGQTVNTSLSSYHAAYFYQNFINTVVKAASGSNKSGEDKDIKEINDGRYKEKIRALSAVFSKISGELTTNEKRNYELNLALNNHKKEIISQMGNETFSRISAYVEEKYLFDLETKRNKVKDCDWTDPILKKYGVEGSVQKKSSSFVETMTRYSVRSKPYYCHFLDIYKDATEYQNSLPKVKDGTPDSYEKKLAAAEILEKSCPEDLKNSFVNAGMNEEEIKANCLYLSAIIRYYIAIKIVRNKCNHAFGQTRNNTEKQIESLVKLGIIPEDIPLNDYYQLAYRLIRKGLQVSEQVPVKPAAPLKPLEQSTPVSSPAPVSAKQSEVRKTPVMSSVPPANPVQPAAESLAVQATPGSYPQAAYFTVNQSVSDNLYSGMMRDPSGVCKAVTFRVDQGRWKKKDTLFCSVTGVYDNVYQCHVISRKS